MITSLVSKCDRYIVAKSGSKEYDSNLFKMYLYAIDWLTDVIFILFNDLRRLGRFWATYLSSISIASSDAIVAMQADGVWGSILIGSELNKFISEKIICHELTGKIQTYADFDKS